MGAFTASAVITGDYRRYCPWRTTTWRWDRAVVLFREEKRSASWEDPGIKLALDYQRAMDSADTDAKRAAVDRRMPNVAAAHAIYIEAGVVRDEIEARLLAGQSFATIAVKLALPAAVIETFEQLFFNVSDALKATGWLFAEAVGINIFMGRAPTRGETWKYIALAAGAPAVDLLVADYFGRAEPRIPDRSLLARKIRFAVWEATVGFSLADTVAVMEGYRALLHEPHSDGVDSPARQEMMALLARLQMLVDLGASAVAGREAAERRARKSKRQNHSVKAGRRTAPTEKDHGRSQKQAKDEDPVAEFSRASENLTTDQGG